MPKHTAKSVRKLLGQLPSQTYGYGVIPTEQDILDIGLREALRRLAKHYRMGLYMDPDSMAEVLGVRLVDSDESPSRAKALLEDEETK